MMLKINHIVGLKNVEASIKEKNKTFFKRKILKPQVCTPEKNLY
jgi:hypothetical protein